MSSVTLDESWPFQRDVHDPVSPPPRLAEIRAVGDVAQIHMYDGTPAVLVTHFDHVREVLTSPVMSSDGRTDGYPYVSEAQRKNRGTRPTLDRLDSPEHDVQRSMLAGSFTVKRVREMRPSVENYIDGLLDEMESSGPVVDLVARFADPIPAFVITKMLDLPESDTEFFMDRVQVWSSDKSTPEEIARATADFHQYFDRVIDERGTGDDLISRLVRNQVETGQLPKDQLLQLLHLIITAGFDTTASAIALGTMALLQTPGAWAEIATAGDELLPNAIEEILRYVSVAHHAVFRFAREPISLGDETVPAHTAVVASTMAANRDPDRFPEPDRLDIHRDARGHLAFGMGLHQCIGQALACMELKAVFERLPKRFPTLHLAGPVEDLQFAEAIVYGARSMPVTW